MRVRRAKDGDLPSILSIESISFAPQVAFSEDMLSFFLRTGIALVAEEGKILGFVMGAVSGDWGKVITLDVHPLNRGRGAGFALIESLEQELLAAGAKAVQLEVSVENSAALALYSQLGYKEAVRLENYYGRGKDAVLMWKRLYM